MNGLKEIQECIKNFICEKAELGQQITEIEEKRTQLANQRNEMKSTNGNWNDISELGRQISELGNKSQDLQNRLDFKFYEVKSQVNLAIDNLIAGGIRGIRRINEEIQEIEESVANQKERNEKYKVQSQEFFERFGRMPELSENALKDSELQEEKIARSDALITELKMQIRSSEDEMTELARIKREFKNGNWNKIVKAEDDEDEAIHIESVTIGEIAQIEEISVEEIAPIEELYVEEFQPIEELDIEEFKPVEELHVEKFEPVEEPHIEEIEPIEELHIEEFNEEVQGNPEPVAKSVEDTSTLDEIEKLAREIVEQIAAEQARDLHINEVKEVEETQPENIVEAVVEETEPENIVEIAEEKVGKENIVEAVEEEEPEDIITYEENRSREKVIVPLFGQREKILNITVKIEEGELVYKAQMGDGEEVKIYPAQIGEENVLLRDKQNREECKEILINYAVSEYKMFDKKVVKKIDPLVCELLIECAERYGYTASELVYDYAMSYSDIVESDIGLVPEIVYNISYLEQSELSRKEKSIISKICKNARRNSKIEIIETLSGFKKIKYVFKRLFTANNSNALPEGKSL